MFFFRKLSRVTSEIPLEISTKTRLQNHACPWIFSENQIQDILKIFFNSHRDSSLGTLWESRPCYPSENPLAIFGEILQEIPSGIHTGITSSFFIPFTKESFWNSCMFFFNCSRISLRILKYHLSSINSRNNPWKN